MLRAKRVRRSAVHAEEGFGWAIGAEDAAWIIAHGVQPNGAHLTVKRIEPERVSAVVRAGGAAVAWGGHGRVLDGERWPMQHGP